MFTVGDCASLMQQVAVGQAARAAIVLNNELILEATAYPAPCVMRTPGQAIVSGGAVTCQGWRA